MPDIERQLRDLGRRADEDLGPLIPEQSRLARVKARRRATVVSLLAGVVVLAAGGISARSLLDGNELPVVGPSPGVSSPTPSRTTAGVEIDSENVVMAFGSRGDIWAATEDGQTVNLTNSSEQERNPTISFDGEVLVYERGPELVYLRFDTGESASFARGAEPTFGPLGYLAWTKDGEIFVGSPFADEAVSRPSLGKRRWEASNLAWDQSLELLYYDIAQGHGTAPFLMDVHRVKGWECAECGGGLRLFDPQPITPVDAKDGDIFVHPTLGQPDVLRLCCATGRFQNGPWEEVEIAYLDIFDTGTTSNRLRSLSDVEGVTTEGVLLDHSGQLAAEVDGDTVRWRVTDRRAWFVTVGSHLWLVRWRAEAVELPYLVDGGVAVNPTFSDSPYIHSYDEF